MLPIDICRHKMTLFSTVYIGFTTQQQRIVTAETTLSVLKLFDFGSYVANSNTELSNTVQNLSSFVEKRGERE